jgi:hypothetical protein
MVTGIKRRILVTGNLYFEYEVSPHRRISAGVNRKSPAAIGTQNSAALSQTCELSTQPPEGKAGLYIPFKQNRLQGQINPLKPPVHVETVLIGRALGQQTGYVAGVGFRIRDDGYVEGEFEHGVEKFLSFEDFEKEVKSCLKKND